MRITDKTGSVVSRAFHGSSFAERLIILLVIVLSLFLLQSLFWYAEIKNISIAADIGEKNVLTAVLANAASANSNYNSLVPQIVRLKTLPEANNTVFIRVVNKSGKIVYSTVPAEINSKEAYMEKIDEGGAADLYYKGQSIKIVNSRPDILGNFLQIGFTLIDFSGMEGCLNYKNFIISEAIILLLLAATFLILIFNKLLRKR